MVIEVEHLSKKIGKTEILTDICLTLESGYIYGLQGINGSGKTMLMRALCGLIYPTQGHVAVDRKILGKDMDFPPSIGILIESPAFLSGYTGWDNLKIVAQLQKMDHSEIEKALSAVGLNPHDTRKYRKYSLGMKQRLGIAGAILGSPELVVLDEPFNALDAEGTKIVHQLILQQKKKGKLIVLACHIADELSSLADVCFKLENGCLMPAADC